MLHGLPTPLPLTSFKTIMQEELPAVNWIVEHILAKGDRMVLFGEFGSMKSWLLLDLGLSIASGTLWLNHFPIRQQLPVLYIDEEMNLTTLWRRIKQLGSGREYQNQCLPFQALSHVGLTFGPTGAQNLLDALKQSDFHPDVIIVETFRRVIVGSENEARDVTAFWKGVEPILHAGKTLIISHHMRKPSQQGRDDNRNRASGSTDILAGTDTGFAIQRKGPNLILLECVKSRVAREPKPFFASLSGPAEDGPIRLLFEGYKDPNGDELGELNRAMQIAEEMVLTDPDQIYKTSAIESYVEAEEISRRTASRALTELARSPQARIHRVSHGRWQAKTPAQGPATVPQE